MNCDLYVTNRLVSLFWDRLVVPPSSTRGLSLSLLIILNYCIREATENHSKYIQSNGSIILWSFCVFSWKWEYKCNTNDDGSSAHKPDFSFAFNVRVQKQTAALIGWEIYSSSVTPITTGRVDGHGEKARVMRGKNQDVVCFPVVTKPTLMFDDLMVSPTDHRCMDTYMCSCAVGLRDNVHNGCIERCTVQNAHIPMNACINNNLTKTTYQCVHDKLLRGRPLQSDSRELYGQQLPILLWRREPPKWNLGKGQACQSNSTKVWNKTSVEVGETKTPAVASESGAPAVPPRP